MKGFILCSSELFSWQGSQSRAPFLLWEPSFAMDHMDAFAGHFPGLWHPHLVRVCSFHSEFKGRRECLLGHEPLDCSVLFSTSLCTVTISVVNLTKLHDVPVFTLQWKIWHCVYWCIPSKSAWDIEDSWQLFVEWLRTLGNKTLYALFILFWKLFLFLWNVWL